MRAAPKTIEISPRLCAMWASGRCVFGTRCRNVHAFDEPTTPKSESAIETSCNSPDATRSRKVISIEDSLPRQRLDLFPNLDFSNELEFDGDTLLSILSRELLELPFISADGDDSPWNLPH